VLISSKFCLLRLISSELEPDGTRQRLLFLFDSHQQLRSKNRKSRSNIPKPRKSAEFIKQGIKIDADTLCQSHATGPTFHDMNTIALFLFLLFQRKMCQKKLWIQ
jgi:hypothetical protein